MIQRGAHAKASTAKGTGRERGVCEMEAEREGVKESLRGACATVGSAHQVQRRLDGHQVPPHLGQLIPVRSAPRRRGVRLSGSRSSQTPRPAENRSTDRPDHLHSRHPLSVCLPIPVYLPLPLRLPLQATNRIRLSTHARLARDRLRPPAFLQQADGSRRARGRPSPRQVLHGRRSGRRRRRRRRGLHRPGIRGWRDC
jgi:hypothetical protein